MTLPDLIANVQQRNQYVSKAEAAKAVSGVIDAIKSLTIGQMPNGSAAAGKLTLVGFGTFSVKCSKARVGRNPTTGAAVNIPASSTLKFKASKSLKIPGV